jgi:spermidine/putrescine-binding protein
MGPIFSRATPARLLLAALLLSGGAQTANAQERDLVIVATGGAFEATLRQQFYEPFTKENGARIRSVAATNAETWTKLKAMRQAGKMEWDIVTAYPEDLVAQADQLEPFQCSEFKNLSKAIDGACLGNGFLRSAGGVNIVYNTTKFPQGGPKTWAEFWDTKRFPGPRAMPNSGAPWWPLMAALMADGVAPNKLFPLDLDRAFKKMSEIRPAVSAWWRTGDQAMQLLRSGEVTLSMMWSGSALLLKGQGEPLAVEWNGAVPNVALWAMVKGSGKRDDAIKFLDYFVARPEAHLAFAKQFYYDTANKEVLGLYSREELADHAAFPENAAKMAVIDATWVAENRTKVLERWNQWLAQ